MRLKALVRRVSGQHRVGGIVEGRIIEKETLPPAAWVVIEEKEAGFFLIRYSNTADFAGDTWHPSIEDAKKQARSEFDIESGDWFREED
jgi:hypothetical protein